MSKGKIKITKENGEILVLDGVLNVEIYQDEEELLSHITKMNPVERKKYVIHKQIPAEYEKIHETLSTDHDNRVRFFYVQCQEIPAKYKNVHDNLCRDDDPAVRRNYCAFQKIPAEYYEIHERLGSDSNALVRLTYAANLSANPTVVAYMKYTRKI